MSLPFAPAADRNRGPILEVLRAVFADASLVLEIGGGTGQHAVYFATGLPHLRWQPTERPAALAGLQARVAAEAPANCLPPLPLDVCEPAWPAVAADAVFTANTLHIMGWPAVEALFAGLARRPAVARVAIYGPFRYGGDFTTPSNAAFDASLRARDPASGLRDFEAVAALARAAGLELHADHAMPANNQLLVWRRAAVQ